MKTRILLTTIGAAAIAAITFNTSGALLSPRAAGNQINIAASTANDRNLVAVDQGLAASPRIAGNQITAAASVANDTNPTVACRNMTASPKAIQACAANPAAAMPCCAKSVAAAK